METKNYYTSSNKIEAQKIHKKHEKLILEAAQQMSKLESVQKSVIITHISINKLNTLIYLTRVFVKDCLSRDHGLHSRDHSRSPNHSAPQTMHFLMVFASLLNYTVLHVWFM